MPEGTRPKRTLNDRGLKALKPAPKGATYDLMDAVVPGFRVRVSETGRKTFVLLTRFPGSRNPTRRSLGEYGAITLEKARIKARDWLELIRKGVDPGAEAERLRLAEQRKRANSFAAVVEDYIKFAVIGPDPENPRQRRGARVARELRDMFAALWGAKSITEISRENVQAVIKTVRDHGTGGALSVYGVKHDKLAKHKGGAPGQARNLLGTLKAFFAWAIAQNEYGIEQSPCRDIKAKSLVGDKSSRDRALNELELAALWRVTRRLKYPFRQVYRLLILTGLRLGEVANASWPEFNLKDRTWVIPASRMKGVDGKARDHMVPLTDDMLAILDELPRFKRGDYLFTFKFGAKPAAVDDKIKLRVDAKMLGALRALARMRGEDDPARVRLQPWVNHDLRRTVRTQMSRLRIDHDVKEAVLAHAKPGLVGTYDVYDLADEKREALELWAKRVREIVSPAPDNVVKLQPAQRV
jgi:integrase